MIETMVITIAILLLVTAWITRQVRGRSVKAGWVVPLYGSLACFVLAGGVGVYYVNALRTYDRCVATAERSVGGRAQTLLMYDVIDKATGTNKYTSEPIVPGQPSLRGALPQNLPILKVSDCTHP